MSEQPTHFNGKNAIQHVAEKQAEGVISSAEIHGTEVPGHIGAFADSLRDTVVLLFLVAIFDHSFHALLFILLGWTAWKAGRASWLGWSRLERLHRVLEQEKWEIDHNRPQEREELTELYRAKGLEGKLLNDVIDVLMADGDRLLKVMVEEELGLSLKKLEHPIKQGVGAFIGSLIPGLILIAIGEFASPLVFFLSGLLMIALASALLAHYARNRLIPAITWNLAIASLALGITYYTHQLFL